MYKVGDSRKELFTERKQQREMLMVASIRVPKNKTLLRQDSRNVECYLLWQRYSRQIFEIMNVGWITIYSGNSTKLVYMSPWRRNCWSGLY